MRIDIYSKIDKNILLHTIYKFDKDMPSRIDITEGDKFLQVSVMKFNNGKTFIPHKHIPLDRGTNITHESWVIIKGKVKAILYDMDDTVIHEEVLEVGDCSISFSGAHNYLFMEDDSLIYEYKNGPYLGPELDRKRLG